MLTCPMCESPCRDYEWMPHVRDCMKIEAKRTGRTDAEILTELHELQADAKRQLLWPPGRHGEATPEQPFPFET